MTPEDAQTLLEVARWTLRHQNRRSTIRQLAETEENYLLLIRELERVESQRFLAQARHAEATLTLVEWLETLNYFHWRCAYCQSKPFQVMSHPLPLSQGGTTATNCVPACYRCRQFQKREDERIRSSLALIHPCHVRKALNCTSKIGYTDQPELPAFPPDRELMRSGDIDR